VTLWSSLIRPLYNKYNSKIDNSTDVFFSQTINLFEYSEEQLNHSATETETESRTRQLDSTRLDSTQTESSRVESGLSESRSSRVESGLSESRSSRVKLAGLDSSDTSNNLFLS